MAATENVRQLPQSHNSGAELIVPCHGVVTLFGYGIQVRVDRGHLLLEDGIGPERRCARLPRVGHGLRRLVVVGSDGVMSLAALRWLSDQKAGFAMIERDGSVLVTTGPARSSDVKLRRAQALAHESGAALRITRELIRQKLTGQELVARSKLLDTTTADAIATFSAELPGAENIASIRLIEAQAASAYWLAWRRLPMTFPKKDLPRVPEHWRSFGTRISPLTGSPRLAVTPGCAMMNYVYALLESGASLAARALGLDPAMGIFHVDQPNRDSLACDLMEPVRPLVDAYLLDWITYRLDKIVFDLFIRSDEIVDTFSTFEGKVKFFETAAQRDPDNVFVLQHFARMLLREKKLTLALTQIDSAIAKDKTKAIRSLHHTRGLVLTELALTEENDDLARKWLAQSEREFIHCITAKESDDYGHSGVASLYLAWSRRKKLSDDEGAEYLEKAESAVAKGLRVVREKTALLIISSDIQKDLGNQPERISKLRQAVDADSASAIGRYLLARAYRGQGQPHKTIEVLEPIITTDFKQVRAYVEYTRAMLEIGEPIRKCVATISQCRLDGESDSAFVGLYGGLLYIDGQYANATKLWEDAKEQNFSYEERIRKQYIPRDPADPSKRMRFTGTIEHAKPGLVLIQPEEGPVVISTQTLVGSTALQRGQKVSFELIFSAKGPFAEHLQNCMTQ